MADKIQPTILGIMEQEKLNKTKVSPTILGVMGALEMNREEIKPTILGIMEELEKRVIYTITFDLGESEGTAPAAIKGVAGSEVAAPDNPVWEGEGDFTFTGWSPEVPTIMPTEDTTCVAQWEATAVYTITFDLGESEGTAPAAIKGVAGSEVAAPDNPVWEGEGDFTFTGWSPEVPTIMPTEDTTCVAQWEATAVYTITFDLGESEGTAPAAIKGVAGSEVAAPDNPVWEGEGDFTFTGWSPEVPTIMPTEDTTCVAQWEAVVV